MKIKSDSLAVITAATDQRTKEGFFVDAAGVIMASATAVPDGLITDGGDTGGITTLVPCAGGTPGIFGVKLSGTPGSVVKGSRLVLVNDGTAKIDPATGARVQVAEAREAGTAGEIIQAVLINPPVVLS